MTRIIQIGVAAAIGMFIWRMDVVARTSPEFRITFLQERYDLYFDTWVYESAPDSLYSKKAEYIAKSRMLCGDKKLGVEPPTFLGCRLNVIECAEVAREVSRLGLSTSDIFVSKKWCHTDRGIIACVVSLNGTFSGRTQNVQGLTLAGPMTTSVLDMLLIYRVDKKQWQFVDSVNINPFGTRGEKRRFVWAKFDKSGEHCYYKKHLDLLRFNVDIGVIDTLPGGDALPGLPFNSMNVLVLSMDSQQLALLDRYGSVSVSLRCDFEWIYDVAEVSDSVFVLAGWRPGFLGKGRESVIVLADFSAQSCRDLIETKGMVEFLDIELRSDN